MTLNKIAAFLFGVVATATVIGLLLVGTAFVHVLQAGAPASLLQHPLYVAGSDLVVSSLLVGLPFIALRQFWPKH